MPEEKPSTISRRGFIQRAPAAVLAAGAASALAAETPAPQARGTLPRRVLGRTKLEVTCMTLGTAPCGISEKITADQIGEIVKEALDLGVNYVDTAPGYQCRAIRFAKMKSSEKARATASIDRQVWPGGLDLPPPVGIIAPTRLCTHPPADRIFRRHFLGRSGCGGPSYSRTLAMNLCDRRQGS